MAGVVETTKTFATNEVITSTLMNNIIDETSFTEDALANSTLALTAGKMKVATSGITSNELAVDAVTTNSISASSVTTAKIADLNVTTGKITDSAVTTAKIADLAVTAAKIAHSNFPIQIVQAVKADIQTIAGTVSDFNDITGLSLTLTRVNPSASGKVRIQATVSASSSDSNHGLMLRIMRDSTAIGLGDASGSRIRASSTAGYASVYGNGSTVIDFIDSSPGSSATVTYKIQGKMYSTASAYINRSVSDPNVGDYIARTISTMTLTELTP